MRVVFAPISKYVKLDGAIVQVGHKKSKTCLLEVAVFCTKMTLIVITASINIDTLQNDKERNL